LDVGKSKSASDLKIVLAATPHGAVAAFAGYPGVFTFMAAGGAIVWYTAWGKADAARAQHKAEDFAARLARRFRRVS
jgi:hypothetical protein